MAQQKSLIYSFVARGTVIVAEYTDFSGNFSSIAVECLNRLPATNNRFTYTCDGHTFNYLVHDGFTYCIVAVEAAGRHVSMAFLERIKEDFNKRYSRGKASTAVAKSLNKDFGPKMKAHMQYCVDHPEEGSKLMQVKAQVSEVKAVMMGNIDKVLERGAKVDELMDKTADLHIEAQTCKLIILNLQMSRSLCTLKDAEGFKRGATQIKRKMWYQNMKIKMIVLAIIIILVLIIVLSVCRGFAC